MNNKLKQLRRIKIENIIWIIYLFIIGFNLYSNKLEKIFVESGNSIYKEKFRKINKIILTVILIIYIYYVYISYIDIKELDPNCKKRQKDLTYLAFISSVLFLIGGAISLYITTNSNILDEEIPII